MITVRDLNVFEIGFAVGAIFGVIVYMLADRYADWIEEKGK